MRSLVKGMRVGVIGTGSIGTIVARILIAFECEVMCFDPDPSRHIPECPYANHLDEVLTFCHIVTLHMPVTPSTRHVINDGTISRMRRGVLLANTSRGALIDTDALIRALKSGQVGGAVLDVYEGEAGYFYRDLEGEVVQDDRLARLLSFPNVLLTAHQAFFTREALTSITNSVCSSILEHVHRLQPSQ